MSMRMEPAFPAGAGNAPGQGPRDGDETSLSAPEATGAGVPAAAQMSLPTG